MQPKIINNIFNQDEIDEIYKTINLKLSSTPKVIWDNENYTASKEYIRIVPNFLGRLNIDYLELSDKIKKKVIDLLYKNTGQTFELDQINSITYVEYNLKYGKPMLNVHKDNSGCDLIVDYQLDSNIEWAIGIEETVYDIENNSALTFNPSEKYHWRPSRLFKENDFVKMIFFELRSNETKKVINLEEQHRIQKIADDYYKNKYGDVYE